MTIAVFPLARPTFDVDFAQQRATSAWQLLADRAQLVGSQLLLLDDASLEQALTAVAWRQVELVVILQCSFCDANMALRIAQLAGKDLPIALWAWPEERSGGRLRLNSFCGANLAAHALRLAGHELHFCYQIPEPGADISRLFQPPPRTWRLLPASADAEQLASAHERLAQLRGSKVAVLGEHPPGFSTCSYDAGQLQSLLGLEVQRRSLADLFDQARAVDQVVIDSLYSEESERFANLSELDSGEVRKALALHHSLQSIASEQNYLGLAVRCWPEVFTDYGCALCASMANLSDSGVPAACEADVLGVVTGLLLQSCSPELPWLVDLVDVDAADDSLVLWHCGLAPMSMRDPSSPARATVHSNRKKALLREFNLKPGNITLARLSQARGQLSLVVGSAEVLERPRSFSGTSGVIRCARAAGVVADAVVDFGLEHHLSIVYSQCKPELVALAAALAIPVLDLDQL